MAVDDATRERFYVHWDAREGLPHCDECWSVWILLPWDERVTIMDDYSAVEEARRARTKPPSSDEGC